MIKLLLAEDYLAWNLITVNDVSVPYSLEATHFSGIKHGLHYTYSDRSSQYCVRKIKVI